MLCSFILLFIFLNCKENVMCYNVPFSTGSPEYHRFDIDISLMISLLEYLVFKNGSDEFACRSSCQYMSLMVGQLITRADDNYLEKRKNDASVSADLSRIAWIRNVMQYNRSQRMSNEDVQQYWEDISGVIIYF